MDYLEQCFKILTNFELTKYHCFKFDIEHPEILFAEYSFTNVKRTFFILSPSTTVRDVRGRATQYL